MKTTTLTSTLIIALLAGGTALADTSDTNTSATTASRSASSNNDSVYDQLISVSAGSFNPQAVAISNGTYTFDYGNGATNSFLVEAGWGIRLSRGLYLAENIAYSRFAGSASTVNTSAGLPDSMLTLNMVGLDSRLNYSVEHFPVRWFIPFVEGGYQYTFYGQSGSSDLDSVQGGSGNFVAGAGVRLWINRSSSLDTDLSGTYTRIPIFLTLKWNRIFPNGTAFDLADSNLLAGVSVGL